MSAFILAPKRKQPNYPTVNKLWGARTITSQPRKRLSRGHPTTEADASEQRRAREPGVEESSLRAHFHLVLEQAGGTKDRGDQGGAKRSGVAAKSTPFLGCRAPGCVPLRLPWGAWGAPSVKPLTPDFSSGHDLTVFEMEPCVRLCDDTVEPAWDSLSPSPSAPPPLKISK